MSETPLPSPKELGLEKPARPGRREVLKKFGKFALGAVGILAFGSKTAEAKPSQAPAPAEKPSSAAPVETKPASTPTQSLTTAEKQLSAEPAREKEQFKGELSFGLIKGFMDGRKENAGVVIDRIKDLLENHPISAVMTAEYAFYPFNQDNDKTGYVELQEKDGKYSVGPISDPEYANYLNQLQDLAKKHKTDIFGATFKERVLEDYPIDQNGRPQYKDTMVHIDKNGEIVGIARKGLVTKGDWTLTQNGQTFRTLPLICQDIATETYPGGRPGYPKAKVPNSIQGQYDVLLHPQRLKDFQAEALTDINQGIDSKAAKELAPPC